MTTEKMTVHKALSELKVIGERIEKSMARMTLVEVMEQGSAKVSGIPVSEHVGQMKAVFQSTVDLISRRDAIKRAVVKSNATTEVLIGGITYTVAEAIDMKNNGMTYLRMMANKLTRELASAQANVEYENGNKLETRADGYIKNLYGSTDMKNLAAEAVEEREKFIKSHTRVLVDPLNVADIITRMEADIYAFTTEVDAALSCSNAITEIEVSY